MDTLDQRFMAVLQELCERENVPFRHRINHGYTFTQISIHLSTDYQGPEQWVVEMLGWQRNTDIEGTAHEVNHRELNA
jgi:hypothetical protein